MVFNKSIHQSLLNLVADENFAEIETQTKKQNLFQILGRTYTETWHSMFLGWLLDPQGSHGLSCFPLQCLLKSCMVPILAGNKIDVNKVAEFASFGNLENASVQPSENKPFEYQFSDGPDRSGRFDVFIEFNESDFSGDKTVIIIEQKVKAEIKVDQCKKYINYLNGYYKDCFIIPIFIAPYSALGISSVDTFGSEEWFGIDYQILHDEVLVPCTKNRNINPDSLYLINQYILILKSPMKKNEDKVLTEIEKNLACKLYEKHEAAFDIIFRALEKSGYNIKSIPNQSKIKLQITIDKDKIEGDTIKKFYKNILEYLIKTNIKIDDYLPFPTGPSQYLIANTPNHQQGNEFRSYVEVDNYYMNTSKDYLTAKNDVLRFLKKIGVSAKDK